MRLCALAGLAPRNILSYIIEDTWPPIVSGNQFMSFVLTRVPCKMGVVMLADDVLPKLSIYRNIDPLIPCHNSILLIPSLDLGIQVSLNYSIPVGRSSLNSVKENQVIQDQLDSSKKLWFQQHYIFIIFLPLLMARLSRQEISLDVGSSRLMV